MGKFSGSENVRVINAAGEQLGVLNYHEAQELAKKSDLDLICISPAANPPVVKIMDWSKYQYQKIKEQKRNRISNKKNDLKQMRFSIKIGPGDLSIKLKKIRAFLTEGHRVRIQVFYKGRELAHKEIGYQIIDKIANELADCSVVEQKPQMIGRNLSIVIRSK